MSMESWDGWCRVTPNGPVDVNTDRRMAEMYEATRPCRVVADAAGDYRGWLPHDDSGQPVTPRNPRVIQHKKIFDMQFPYGVQAEVARGRGTVLSLRVELREES